MSTIETDAPPVFIYALTDPRNGAARYVGMSADPAKRLEGHVRCAPDTLVGAWVQELRQAGVLPRVVILETTTPAEARSREWWWIAEQEEDGADLLNFVGTRDVLGKHTRSYRLTEETDRKLRELKELKGRSFSAVVTQAVDLLHDHAFQQPEARLERLESIMAEGFAEFRARLSCLEERP